MNVIKSQKNYHLLAKNIAKETEMVLMVILDSIKTQKRLINRNEASKIYLAKK
ncbi:hypothetical protein F7734_15785 [Scytonema sp. UIC 10036]|uniref:hypothetical protein n=1 Tax=Scytonema sp. UIC 10036 TaxID=2304196 RepID=UPI0012DA8F09|nr:hypothetical protein [Scytonema sp. UIC 10036]MUG93796.1 hypothetical protein [Scytonema sp. UIC 10036]